MDLLRIIPSLRSSLALAPLFLVLRLLVGTFFPHRIVYTYTRTVTVHRPRPWNFQRVESRRDETRRDDHQVPKCREDEDEDNDVGVIRVPYP